MPRLWRYSKSSKNTLCCECKLVAEWMSLERFPPLFFSARLTHHLQESQGTSKLVGLMVAHRFWFCVAVRWCTYGIREAERFCGGCSNVRVISNTHSHRKLFVIWNLKLKIHGSPCLPLRGSTAMKWCGGCERWFVRGTHLLEVPIAPRMPKWLKMLALRLFNWPPGFHCVRLAIIQDVSP
jgi:hypothetical protein